MTLIKRIGIISVSVTFLLAGTGMLWLTAVEAAPGGDCHAGSLLLAHSLEVVELIFEKCTEDRVISEKRMLIR